MEKDKEEKILPLASLNKLQKQNQMEDSTSLPKNLSLELLGLLRSVTKDEVTPRTVDAACKCAREIHKILDLNFRMKQKGM